jgi:protein-tyrosine phosphatase
MRQLLENSELNDVLCDSAGTISAHQGNPPDPRMTAAGKRRGLPMTGRARGVTQSDFERFDLILAMDRSNLEDLKHMAPNDAAQAKIRLFCDFCRTRDAKEVPDPYYGGAHGFERVLDLLEDGCEGILEHLKDC